MASQDNISIESTRSIRAGLCGMTAATLQLIGDVLLYGPECYDQSGSVYFDAVDPSTKDPSFLLASPMAAGSSQRVITGGMTSPFSALLYIIAGVSVLLRPEHGAAGLAASLGFSVTVIGASCYHTAYVYTAFIAIAYAANCGGDIEISNCGKGFEELVVSHATYMRCMKHVIKIGGYVFTVGLFRICYLHFPTKSHQVPSTGELLMPWWMAMFAPGLWLMLVRESGLLRALPAPYGGLIAGGSFNICFFIFFFAITLLAAKTDINRTVKEKTKERAE